ncbi:MAG: hypothetical protein H0V82_07865 [Candidatus Protochlamydia sp.]|nr:hypothetical protein [Candidatus Protochlamydia sp.]
MNESSNVSYTANNQSILNNYADKVSNKINVEPKYEPSYIWSVVSPYIPTWKDAGKGFGEAVSLTYGSGWSNKTIEFVVGKIFQGELKSVSRWSIEGLRQSIAGSAQKTFAEVAKVTITPKALPFITALSGIGGQLAMAGVVTLVGYVYNSYHPNQRAALGELSLDQLFTVDPETNCLRDAFGRLLTEKDMAAMFKASAKYTLIAELIKLCQEMDKFPEDDFQEASKELLENLVKNYCIERSDGSKVFPDGHIITQKDEDIINNGIEILLRVNLANEKKDIKKLVKLLSKHSILPMQDLKGSDLKSNEIIISAKKMPAVFKDEEDWKNFIIRGNDGSFYLYQDFGNKKRGQIIPALEMEKIFKQLAKIELIKEFEREQAMEGLIEDPSKHSILAHKLNQWDKEAIKEFLKKFLIQRESDQALVYFDGTVLGEEEAQDLLQKFALIPPTRKEKNREEKIASLIGQIGGHMPKDLFNQFIIECKDGQFVTRDGKLLSSDEVKFIQNELLKAEQGLEIEENSKIDINSKPEIEKKFQIIDDYIQDDLIKNGCININEGPAIEIELKPAIELENDQDVELQVMEVEDEQEIEEDVENEPEVEVASQQGKDARPNT